jgi:hypothetical protein
LLIATQFRPDIEVDESTPLVEQHVIDMPQEDAPVA